MKTPLALFLSLFFIVPASRAAHEPKDVPIYMRDCATVLRAVNMDAFMTAVAKNEINRGSLKNAEQKLMNYLIQLVHKAPNINHLKPWFQEIVTAFSLSVSTAVRGQDHLTATSINELSQILGIDPNLVRSAVTSAAEDIEIHRPFSIAEFLIRKNIPSIEAYLIHLNYSAALSQLEMVPTPEGSQTTPFTVGPRQFEMIRRVLQYTTSHPGEKVLEIGYQFPGPALGIANYLGVHVTAVDLLIPPDNANSLLANYRVELLTGGFPDAPMLIDALTKKAPFRVIYSLDTIKKDPTALLTNTAAKDFVKKLFELTDPNGGTVIIMNDFGEEPYFTREEAKAAGFEIVRWGTKYFMPDEYRTLMPYHSPLRPIDGLLATFVLRKGQDINRARTISKPSQQ